MAIVQDDTSSANGAGADTLSWAHTCTGSDLMLFVGFGGTDIDEGEVTGVTYNSVAMTKVWDRTQNTYNSTGWYLANPATGSNTVIVTMVNTNTRYMGGAISFTGVDQSTPVDTATEGATNFGTTVTIDVSSATDDLVIDGVVSGDQDPIVGAGQIEKIAEMKFGSYYSMSTEAGAATVTMSWSGGGSTTWSMGGVSINPAAAGGATTVPQSTSYKLSRMRLKDDFIIFMKKVRKWFKEKLWRYQCALIHRAT